MTVKLLETLTQSLFFFNPNGAFNIIPSQYTCAVDEISITWQHEGHSIVPYFVVLTFIQTLEEFIELLCQMVKFYSICAYVPTGSYI